MRENRNPYKDFKENQNKGLVAHQFIISESYLYPDPSGYYKDEITEKMKEGENRRVSGFTEENPGTLGLCGANLIWEDVVDVTRKCLELKNMVGVKLHLMRSDLRQIDALRVSTFQQVVKLLNEKGGILLVHFGGHPFSDKKGFIEYTESLLKIAVESPKVKFVIAHSGYQQWIGFNGLVLIGEYFKNHPELQRNIYADTSAVLIASAQKGATERIGKNDSPLPTDEEIQKLWSKQSDVVETWRQFGMDYVLFGSDFPFYDQETEVKSITLNPFLTDEEKEKILILNGNKLLEEIAK